MFIRVPKCSTLEVGGRLRLTKYRAQKLGGFLLVYIYIYPSASSFRFKFLCHGDFGPTRGIRRFGRHPASGVGPAEAPTVFVTGGGWQNLPTKPGGFICLVNFQKETDVSKNRRRTHVDTGLILWGHERWISIATPSTLLPGSRAAKVRAEGEVRPVWTWKMGTILYHSCIIYNIWYTGYL